MCLGLGLAVARDDTAKGGDQEFVTKASAGGLAEVNTSNMALKQATSGDVKEFARHMIKDHTKSNKELISLADKKGFKVAEKMDAKHQKMAEKLSGLSGAAFDKAYMEGQVKDHEDTIRLFEKQSKSGKDEDLRGWAGKTLPTLKEHLKHAKEVHGKVKGGGKSSGSGTSEK